MLKCLSYVRKAHFSATTFKHFSFLLYVYKFEPGFTSWISKIKKLSEELKILELQQKNSDPYLPLYTLKRLSTYLPFCQPSKSSTSVIIRWHMFVFMCRLPQNYIFVRAGSPSRSLNLILAHLFCTVINNKRLSSYFIWLRE